MLHGVQELLTECKYKTQHALEVALKSVFSNLSCLCMPKQIHRELDDHQLSSPICNARLPSVVHVPNSQDFYGRGQRALHSLLDALATAAAMACAVALATALEAAEASALPKEP